MKSETNNKENENENNSHAENDQANVSPSGQDAVDAPPAYEPLTSDHDGLSRQASASKAPQHRVILLNRPQTQKFCNNSISTAKYNIFTFFPKFLFEQFRRYSNIFFLIVALIQQIPDVSPTGRWTTVFPLSLIFLVSAIKEIAEDIKRHRADDATNRHKVAVLRDNQFVDVRWRDLQVGDVCRVTNKQHIPADMVLLASSEPQSMCYIETSNLDGETNLKIRQGVTATAHLTSVEALRTLAGTVECILPNRHLYEFMGTIRIDNVPPMPIRNEQLLLRGSSLRNTKWVFGVVVYTGHETKVMLNSTSPPLKRSSLEILTNRNMLALFGLLAFLTLFIAAANVIWTLYNMDEAWYMAKKVTPLKNFGMMLLTGFLLFHTIIPISLQVTLEIVRFVQAFFINWDLDMYDEATDTPAMARTSNLNEELGQVKFIFSDKTGTLTRNIMEFKRCSIGGRIYGQRENDYDALSDPDLLTLIKEKNEEVNRFLTAMAVCHTVVPERDPDDPDTVKYQASSPDENALVEASRKVGYVFTNRTPEGVMIEVDDNEQKFELLNVLEFTSDRKRMSVVVREPGGKLCLFVKGADSVICERLDTQGSKHQEETMEHLQEFAKMGLRTLTFAYCYINEEMYKQWRVKYHEASIDMIDRDAKVHQVAEEIEQNLLLLGASAIEDKLQDGVPETIANLMQADIRFWVLTGDKQETAINIGYSCHLFTQSMTLITLSATTLDGTRESLREHLSRFEDRLGEPNDVGLVIDGKTLIHALSGDCRRDFLQLALSCKAVICCRVSPLQKAEVVNLVRENDRQSVTLAIGDGANDVGMIQAAHVGVGISGMEGLQATCASDYSIAQFRFLNKLLLVHGAWNYQRLAKLILYSFYKNVCLYMVLFWFTSLSGFSGQVIFERWSMASYNILFSAAPPLALGIFDRMCSSENRLKYPELYKETQTGASYNIKVFLFWVLNSVYHSAIIFWFTLLCDSDVAFGDGHVGGMDLLGFRVYTYVVLTVCFKAGLEHNAWTWLTHLAIWGSLVTWFTFFLVYSHLWPWDIGSAAMMVGMDRAMFRSALFWFGLFLIPVITLTRDVAWKAFMHTCLKTLRDQVLELEQMNIDPGQVILTETKRRLTEKVPLIKMFTRTATTSRVTLRIPIERMQSGYAFSQEEGGVVRQAELVRAYSQMVQSQSPPQSAAYNSAPPRGHTLEEES